MKDPTVVAETELLNAAAAIEAAAKKLEELRPRPKLVMLNNSQSFTVSVYSISIVSVVYIYSQCI